MKDYFTLFNNQPGSASPSQQATAGSIVVTLVFAAAHAPGDHHPTPPYPPDAHIEQASSVSPSSSIAPPLFFRDGR